MSVGTAHDGHLFARVRARCEVDPGTGCWVWMGASRGAGYGAIKEGGKVIDAHRAMHAAAHGPIPDGMLVCHACDNPRCCNPAHLFLGSALDNHADMVAKGRRPPQPRGSSAAAARLDEATVARIRSLRSRRFSYGEIVRIVGVPRSTVRDILAGRTWAGMAG